MWNVRKEICAAAVLEMLAESIAWINQLSEAEIEIFKWNPCYENRCPWTEEWPSNGLYAEGCILKGPKTSVSGIKTLRSTTVVLSCMLPWIRLLSVLAYWVCL